MNKPTFEIGEDVASVLGATSHVLATVDEIEHAIRALCARSSVNNVAVLLQTQESLMRDALDLVADCVAFESCVDEVNVDTGMIVPRKHVMMEATRRPFNVLTSGKHSLLPEKHTPWVDHMLDGLLQRMDALKLLEKDALRAAACAWGFDLVIIPEWIFEHRRVFSPGFGRKALCGCVPRPLPCQAHPLILIHDPPQPCSPSLLDMPAEAVPCEVNVCPDGTSRSDFP